MKLFYSVNSPYARKVRIVALEKGLMDGIEQVMVNPLENPPELLRINPLAKIPALLLQNGVSLCESPLICEYLDSLSSHNPLFSSGTSRWHMLNRAALADGIMDAAVALVVEGRKPEAQRSPEWRERYHDAITRTLAVLADITPKHEELNIASINLVVALGYISFRHPELNWREPHPALARWYEGFSNRPSMAATQPHP